MKALVVNADAPYCILRLKDARAYVPAEHTDIRKTFSDHVSISPRAIGDDYDDVERGAHLETVGAFK